MLRARTLIPLVALLAALALVLNTGQCSYSVGSVSVGGVEATNLVIGRSFRVDDAFADEVGEDVPLRFQLILPKRTGDSHKIGVQKLPPGGVVQFNFRSAGDAFMESLFIAPIMIPFGPMDGRLGEIGPQLAEQAPAILEQTFEQVTSTAPREVTVGKLRAMELTGTYSDPRDGGSYAYRFVSLPHPDKAQSLYAVCHVRLEFAEVSKAEDHQQTLCGKALSTLKLTDLVVAE